MNKTDAKLYEKYGLPMPDKKYECPACHAESIYSGTLDRFLHTDGSNNMKCWRKMMRMPMGTTVIIPV
jgi:transcription elongation factor Elf1